MEFIGNQITLRQLQRSFFDAYASMFSPMVQQILHVPDVDQERLYLEERLVKVEEQQTFFYCIFDNERDILIGAIEIRYSAEYRGQLYCWLNEQFWGEGRFNEALALALTAYFALHPHLYFITAHVDVSNQRSFWALRKCGFAPLGLQQGPHGMQHLMVYRRKD